MPNCCIVGCYSHDNKRDGSVKFYNFPGKPFEAELRERWIRVVRRINPDGTSWHPTRNSRICSKHFINGKKSSIWSHPASVPSIFPKVYLQTNRKNSAEHKELQESQPHRIATKRRQSLSPSSESSAEPKVCRKNSDEQKELQESLHHRIATNRRQSVSASSESSAEPKIDDYDDVVAEVPTCHAAVQAALSTTCPSNCPAVITFDIARFSSCEVAVQCDIPLNKITKNVACGMEESLRFKGFFGFPSIRTNADMKSVCGVSFEIFNLLLSIIDTNLSPTVSNEDALLMFLMKSKLSLSHVTLSVLFQHSRQLVARIFQATLHYLLNRINDFVKWPNKHRVLLEVLDRVRRQPDDIFENLSEE